ncbi:UDP-N-acetylglucosamine diphosphorylase/glucosamine-1-phosphate N-acetyltransferase [Lewinella marina]|uniref:Glucose-1-phosphate thymidylyltransferase n=1 Tax=Neolewinella marina TaxID=438751 RepID=A0A2G0CF37_9BACT|nr:putative sugar nucleotidyl transferase [Neolewinella marina]NJB85731.1 UDP-N-acetylglucosamine diphosphorylase/glucosamine-1-phosphate N-acetyltransferase [Neolewinella marina]PHK98594.1 glucose-1-phosphate thymidylyltransferase [Neolewinella marina]
MKVVLFDSPIRQALLPLTYNRPVGDLRLGMLTIGEKWSRLLDRGVAYHTQAYLQADYPVEPGEDNLLIDGSLLPSDGLLEYIRDLPTNSRYTLDGQVVLARLDARNATSFLEDQQAAVGDTAELEFPVVRVTRPADLFLLNDMALREDFQLLTRGRTSTPLSPTNTLIGPADQLFIEEGVSLEACTINVTSGPVYFGRDSVILEGCLLRGPVATGAGAVLKMGAKVYGATTIGPYCKVGGEVNNVVFYANSNKGHEGFLGNAVVGEWCNIGADTNASNLKNDYGEVKVWSYAAGARVPTGLMFHGLILADHAKVGINTMLNTGSVVGFSANVFGAGFPPAFLPSFTWGGAEGLQTYRLDKAIATAERMMERRGKRFTPRDRERFEQIFSASERYRQSL